MSSNKLSYKDIVKNANSKGDMVVLVICLTIILIISAAIFLFGLVVAVDVPSAIMDDSTIDYFGSIFNIILLLALGLVAILVITRMMRQIYLGNALQVEYSDYVWLRKWSNEVARDFEMPKVEIMITQDPVMNAFAFGFMKPYTIVLNSGSVRYLNKQQLKAIVVHEMAHIKYRHAQIGTYLSILRSVPAIGSLFGWILDFWSRRIELTADRLALWYLQDAETVKMALIRVHVGPDVADSFNDIARKWQVYMADNTFNKFTQTFSSHPFLMRRLQHIDRIDKKFIHPIKPEKDAPNATTS